jgi:hypothetical protein
MAPEVICGVVDDFICRAILQRLSTLRQQIIVKRLENSNLNLGKLRTALVIWMRKGRRYEITEIGVINVSSF